MKIVYTSRPLTLLKYINNSWHGHCSINRRISNWRDYNEYIKNSFFHTTDFIIYAGNPGKGRSTL